MRNGLKILLGGMIILCLMGLSVLFYDFMDYNMQIEQASVLYDVSPKVLETLFPYAPFKDYGAGAMGILIKCLWPELSQ